MHGDRTHHDAVVGREAFDLATGHLRSLLAAGIPTGIQTTVVAGGEWVLDWMADFCLAEGVSQWCVLPFIPRGSGYRTQGELRGASQARLCELRTQWRPKLR
ncbi:hypothetical protein BJI69_17620 [Luteibacter rhizovicinus DSM 16549]|uniref:Uncharacterized protein n=1 Tax=Luteibacter rhizovicinus DSM 16549 TaxID=1440763 RepID=A0A0G9HC46_9GAMM|nr:hypothetical protein [Luteibacter rhizovicinus]APG05539.1 hypothetical protein BJI69_17620 [Luteibacter rhizovicinus DSM 16549]KLD67066.1 hypothetical protein Y883_10960 [Luteibacter rhizovicinus DSM 16549]KLD74085.1 hypothetical protein Y886_34575 [Xanthomonas hyacinthi DSM 19077]